MATKNARGRTTLTELKKTTVDERGAEHIAPGVRATTTRTTHYAFMSDGSVLRRDAYKVEYSNLPEGRYCPDSSDSGTWHTRIQPTDTRRDLNRKTGKAEPARLSEIVMTHGSRIDALKAKGYIEVKGAR